MHSAGGLNGTSAYSADLLPYIAEQVEPEDKDASQADFNCERIEESVALHRAKAFQQLQNQRRSLRYFSQDPFPEELLLACIATAGTAPSGAHQQPWHFSIVQNANLKQQIRDVVEQEEQINYDKRMKQSWLADLNPIFKDSLRSASKWLVLFLLLQSRYVKYSHPSTIAYISNRGD